MCVHVHMYTECGSVGVREKILTKQHFFPFLNCLDYKQLLLRQVTRHPTFSPLLLSIPPSPSCPHQHSLTITPSPALALPHQHSPLTITPSPSLPHQH